MILQCGYSQNRYCTWHKPKMIFIRLGIWKSVRVQSCTFVKKITPNRIILAKLQYYELFGQNLLFCTFGSKVHFLHFLAKIALYETKLQFCKNSNLSHAFPDALIRSVCYGSLSVYRHTFSIIILDDCENRPFSL